METNYKDIKVLYVFPFNYNEYLADCIYHGLIDGGFDVYETHYPGYMMSNYEEISGQELCGLYGRGFTLYGRMNHKPQIDSSEIIIEKIRSKFYDLIIYGCIYTHFMVIGRQCLDYLDEVKKYYPRSKVHFIDGSDDITTFAQQYNLDQYGIVWKRELPSFCYGNPISFAIPESLIRNSFPEKTEIFSSKIIKPVPGSFSTPKNYTFFSEQEYYDAYAKSYYGFTCKKMGWDCMRHYEILLNKTIPYFYNLENCPPTVLVNFPKNIILEMNKHSWKDEVPSDYDDWNDYIFSYTKKNLTTKKLVERFL
jgi:hypothetical protein